MSLIAFIVLGALAGWLVGVLLGDGSGQGTLLNLLVGSAGAFMGGFLFTLLGGDGVAGFNLSSFVVAVIGSAAMLVAVKAIRG
jgi:uncharacterized membrane protein YeaQ/YmgE (transglycosylase-associated protein family)